MLLKEFLIPMRITHRRLAEAMGVHYQGINEIVNRWRGITPSTALRLARFFGISSGFWMNLQLRWDLYQVEQAEVKELKTIRPHRVSA